jgi:hypothetical protein
MLQNLSTEHQIARAILDRHFLGVTDDIDNFIGNDIERRIGLALAAKQGGSRGSIGLLRPKPFRRAHGW